MTFITTSITILQPPTITNKTIIASTTGLSLLYYVIVAYLAIGSLNYYVIVLLRRKCTPLRQDVNTSEHVSNWGGVGWGQLLIIV